MYKTILTLVALSTATGGGLYYHDRTKLNGLECEVTDTATYSNPATQTSNRTIKPTVTWVFELSNNEWRYVSVNGVPLTELAKNLGNKIPDNQKQVDWVPLRTTDDAYVLMEKDDHTSGDLHYTSPSLIINRITGVIIGSETVYNQTDHWSIKTDSDGHCTPIHIGAKL